LLAVHGLIHVLVPVLSLGRASAIDSADSPLFGSSLIAALTFLVAAGSIFIWPRWWWVIGFCAVIVSMVAIVPAWTDAKVGAFANAIVIVGVVFGFLSQGPFSLRAEYDEDVENRVPALPAAAPITDADLAHLPVLVQRYLRTAGIVGQPRVRNFHVTMHGRFRSGRESRWMPVVAEQHNFVDPPARYFYMNASMFGIPAQGYHRFAGSSASMRVKAAASCRWPRRTALR
jgi:hypothetical protein